MTDSEIDIEEASEETNERRLDDGHDHKIGGGVIIQGGKKEEIKKNLRFFLERVSETSVLVGWFVGCGVVCYE